MEQKLFDAARDGNVDVVKEILKNNPKIKVNWKNDYGGTALHTACNNGQDAVVFLLLAHPGIDVNQKNNFGNTPFKVVCENGRTTCARLLLKDSRVKVNEPDNDGDNPLWYAAYKGQLDAIKWWIASGRGMDLGQPGSWTTDAIGAARKWGKTEVASLLERSKVNPSQTREQIRKELGITGNVKFQCCNE